MDRETARKIVILYDRTSVETRIRIIDRLHPVNVVHWYNFKEVVKETLKARVDRQGCRIDDGST